MHPSSKIGCVIFVILGVSTAGCVGGSETGTELAPRTITWSIDNTYTDGSIYNPYLSLKEYEIYVRQDNNFLLTDPYVVVNAIDSDGRLVNSFDLRLAFGPLSLSRGVKYYVAMRVTTMDGTRSYLSPPSTGFLFQ